jgi:hypothetical protein
MSDKAFRRIVSFKVGPVNVGRSLSNDTIDFGMDSLDVCVDASNMDVTMAYQGIPIIEEPLPSRSSISTFFVSMWNGIKRIFTSCRC